LDEPFGPSAGIVSDAVGSIYFTSLHCIFKLDRAGVLRRVAGLSRSGYSGDGGPAVKAGLNRPSDVVLDNTGNLYIADDGNHRVRKVSPNGVIVTVAGSGQEGYSGDGGPATKALLSQVPSLAIDGTGNLYIADFDNDRVRRVSSDGIITTAVGTGEPGYSGDGGLATNATLHGPHGVAVDGAGNLYIADLLNSRIRKVNTDGTISTVAGYGHDGYSGDGGPATSAQMKYASRVAADSAGNIYIADMQNDRVRKVSPDGVIVTVAGGGQEGDSSDGGPATKAQLSVMSVAVDRSGNLYIGAPNNFIVRKVLPDGTITTVAANYRGNGYLGDGEQATSAHLTDPWGVAVDRVGNLYITEAANHQVRKVSPDGIITRVAGNGASGHSGDGGPATAAQLNSPFDVALDTAGNLFIATRDSVRRVDANGTITTVAGTGERGYSGDGGPATKARLNLAGGVVVDGDGNLYIADVENHRVRKVSLDGIITTAAGTGEPGYSGDGKPAVNARLQGPSAVTLDKAGNLYIADEQNVRVRKVSVGGIITTVAGNGEEGYTQDGERATTAMLRSPQSVAVDNAGNLYIVLSHRVRKVSPRGILTDVAGDGSDGYSGDGGPAEDARLNEPSGVAVDGVGNIYVADTKNSRVRRLSPRR
jgi:sugar lactone lactonase YvrE